MSDHSGYQRPGIAGSGTIACGLAACVTASTPVRLLARSDASAWRAEESAHAACAKLGADPAAVRVTTSIEDLADCDVVVESVVEDMEVKTEVLGAVSATAGDADLASTTSSLLVSELAERSGSPDRLFGLHVFNPVTKMDLVELCLPEGLRPGISDRARGWCDQLGKRAIEVPDQPGFVVNRLLFPYLFDAVRLLEGTGMAAEDVDTCMTLGTGHPMGPLKLLDLVGIDVAVAIGKALHADSGEAAHLPPGHLERMAEDGKLGRKSGEGFYQYG